jgi:hypothetical protein
MFLSLRIAVLQFSHLSVLLDPEDEGVTILLDVVNCSPDSASHFTCVFNARVFFVGAVSGLETRRGWWCD